MSDNNKEVQKFGKKPTAVRKTDHYQEEYVPHFAEKWDELINWDAREETIGDFFIEELKKRGVKRVLDVATGTGFDSVRLIKAGFDVVSADGSPEMLARAFQNAREHDILLRTVQADWRYLTRSIHEKFDAVICIGNSFTHLFSEHDRRKTLAEFYSVLKHDGVLFLDHRNYDGILDEGFSSKHSFYYAGKNVKAEPEHIDSGLARFRYEFPDNSVYHLNMFPLRKNYVRRLMTQVGFQRIHTFADFKEDYKEENPDFFIHVAEKAYLSPEDKKKFDSDQGTEDTVEVAREYYNSDAADRFYATIWGGKDIHVGSYEYDGEPILDASQRTNEKLVAKAPKLNEDTKVIDLGAAYGGFARYLAETYGCHVSCLNISEIQNDRNRKMTKEAGLDYLLDIVDGSFEDVPYSDESYDVAFSQDSILHASDRAKVFSEASRILKSGGYFIFTDPMQKHDAPKEELQPVLDRIHLDSMGSVEKYKELAEKVGMEVVEIEEHPEQLVNHYSSVLREIENRYDELVGVSDKEYIDRMREGLKHWIENGKKGNLNWGFLVFRKK